MTTPSGPTKTNLDIAIQMAEVMAKISEQLESQSKLFQQQTTLAEQLVKALEGADKFDPTKTKALSETLNTAADHAGKFGKGTEDAVGHTSKLVGVLLKAGAAAKKLVVPAEFINGFKAGLNLSTNLLKGMISLGGTALGLFSNIGGTFLSLPGRFVDFFANSATGGTDDYRVALEELRKEFGNLEIGTSKSVKHMTEDLKNFSSVGVGFGRVFGYGRAGLAALLRENMALASEMGPMFNRMAATLGENSLNLTVLRKATGLSGTAFKALTIAAEGTGQSMDSVTSQMIKGIAQAERTFGISSKEIGKDLDAMLKDTSTFGHVAPDVMIKTSIYVRKLGISIETLKKVMEKSLNFEDAAQQAASLSEAFNVNITAMSLMKEQDPTRKLDMIRDAFFRTGRSVEALNLQEMKALSNTTGLSDEELRLSFSQKNRALSQAQINEQMKKGQKHQISQQEAMVQLAKSIERLTQSGSALNGSFMDRFMRGFETGIHRSSAFRQVVHSLQRSMRTVEMAGRSVGRMFVELFPGIRGLLGGFADLFNPDRFRSFMNRIVGLFRNWFTALRTDPVGGTQTFLTGLKDTFIRWFGASASGGGAVLNGMKDFFKAVATVAAGGLRWAIQQVTGGLRTFTGALRAALAPGGGGFKGLLKGLFGDPSQSASETTRFFGGLASSLREPLIALWGELKNLFVTLLPELKEAFKKYAPELIGAFFAPAVVSSVIRGSASGIASAAAPALMKAVPWSSLASGAGEVVTAVGGSTIAVGAFGAALAALTVGFATNAKATASFSEKATDVFQGLGHAVGKGLGYITKGLIAIIDFIPNLITSSKFRGDVLDALGTFLGSLTSGIMSLGNWVLGLVGGLVTGFLDEIGQSELSTTIKTWLSEVKKGVTEFTSSFKNNFKEIGEFIWNAWAGLVKPVEDRIIGFLTTIEGGFRRALDWFKNLPGTVIADLTKLGSWLEQHNPFNRITDAMQTVNSVADRIFSHSINTVVANDLRKVTPAADQFQKTLSGAVENGFKAAVAASATGTAAITSNVQAASDATNNLQQATAAAAQLQAHAAAGSEAPPAPPTPVIPATPTQVTAAAANTAAGVGSSGGAATAQSASDAASAIDGLKGLVKSLPTLREFFGEMASVVVPHGLAAKTTAIKGVLGLVKDLADISSSLSAPGGATRNVWSEVFVPSLALLAYFVLPDGQTVPGVPNAQGHRGSFDKVLTGLGTLSFPHGLTGKVTQLKNLFELTKSISEAGSSIGGQGGTRNVWSEVFVPFITMLSYFVLPNGQTIPGLPYAQGHRGSFDAVLKGLDTLSFPHGLTGKATQLKSLFESIKAISEAGSSIGAAETSGSFDESTITKALSNVTKVIGAIKLDTVDGVQNPLTHPDIFSGLDAIRHTLRGKGTVFSAISTNLDAVSTALGELAPAALTSGMTAANGRIQGQTTALGEIITALDWWFGGEPHSVAVARTVTAITDNLKGSAIENIRGMVRAYSDFSTELASIAELPAIGATLERFGQRLGAVRTATIERGAFNMTVTVNVTLEASQLSKALFTFTRESNDVVPGSIKLASFNHIPAT